MCAEEEFLSPNITALDLLAVLTLTGAALTWWESVREEIFPASCPSEDNGQLVPISLPVSSLWIETWLLVVLTVTNSPFNGVLTSLPPPNFASWRSLASVSFWY
jgi:hypothetical protein